MKPLRSFLLVALLPFTGSATAATTYNALADFSTTTNPNGVWTFGRADQANGGSFIAYDDFFVDGPFSVWRDNETQVLGTPSVWYRTDLDTLNLHPGPQATSGAFSIIRFTATAAGDYSYSGAFASIDFGSKAVSIYHNSLSVFSAIIGGTQTTSDSDVLTLAMGDTVDVVVGSDGDYFNDATQVSFILTVPEPSLSLLMGVGALAFSASRRRGRY